MKTLCLLSLILFSSLAYSQSDSDIPKYNGAMDELYLNRQPSARVDAMGKASAVSMTGDFGSYYNPALTSMSKGITANASFSSPYYFDETIKLNYLELGYSDKKIGSISFSRYFLNVGEYNYKDRRFYSYTRPATYNSIYRLNYSREIVKNFYAGVNFGASHMGFDIIPVPFQVGNEKPKSTAAVDAFTLDFGLLKKFEFEPTKVNKSLHSIIIGASIYNINKPAITNYRTKAETYSLPQILRLGACYNVKLGPKQSSKDAYVIQSTTNIEYENVVNSEYDVIYKFGEELLIADFFSIRTGYFNTSVNDNQYESGYTNSKNDETQFDFSFGLGLKIPLSEMFNMKNSLVLKFDFAHLSTPVRGNASPDGEAYTTYAFNLNYIP
ncbi:MAG: hypothetical protein JST55_03350 [Bacteroidetes bacterium]|nr:hypothetical protein [Bacteroidota bacterium]